ncbi:aldehyde dehydrogenase family protein [Dactylosporangium roseum]|uniref:Aldehyde dehydrogenase family protein n=1 Tax=Dactylosporangium roseum TaxID=47989 RepID=A0ABY5Z095_9ACTN|nr:aldehyde dehydrogenase family protein [Dactylosporangium roseum]UWZ34485.1 aldehyde dehydrogenase family protein [Dactylosporangium roseum]
MTNTIDNTVYVAGRWQVGEGESRTITNPSTGEPFVAFRQASPSQVDLAITAARAGFDGDEWRKWTPLDRSEALTRMWKAIDERRAELAELIIDSVGSTRSLTEALQVGGPVDTFRYFAELAARGPAGGWERPLPLHHDPVTTSSILVREPAGVVVALSPYNYPLHNLCWKIGGAIAAGCTLVAMPAPQAAPAVVKMFEVLESAGLPAGVLNLVLGGPEQGEILTRDPRVDIVSFTGSVAVGAAVMAQAASAVHKVILELGGKAANILLPGTDLGRDAILPSLFRFVRNAGQGCGATTRILVHRNDYEGFVDAARPILEGFAVGDPRDPATVVGPLVSAAHRERVEAYIDRAVQGGAKILAGGGRPDLPGFFLNPVLIGNTDNSKEICQEELFGPVAAVLVYDTVDEAIEIANSSRFGLNANVVGRTSEAIEVARRLRVGTVTVNGGGGMRPDAPWGGIGESGVGREMGEDGLNEFFEVKHIQWPVDGVGKPQGLD